MPRGSAPTFSCHSTLLKGGRTCGGPASARALYPVRPDGHVALADPRLTLSGCAIILKNGATSAYRVAKCVTPGERPMRQEHAEPGAAADRGRDAGVLGLYGLSARRWLLGSRLSRIMGAGERY
jgi:hypothetical protein